MPVRAFVKRTYVSDDTNNYTVRVASDVAANAAFGFGPEAFHPSLPKGYEMRKVILRDPATGQTLQRPCGTPGAPAFATDGAGALSIPIWDQDANVVMTVSSAIGERRVYGTRAVPAGP